MAEKGSGGGGMLLLPWQNGSGRDGTEQRGGSSESSVPDTIDAALI